MMDGKKLLSDLTIKQEPNTSTAKKVLLSSSSFASLSTKNLTNTRLPSFKPPRDLFLTGSNHSAFNFNSNSKSTRKTFTPNINVTRKKLSSDSLNHDSTPDANIKSGERDKSKKPNFNKKRSVNVVQTKGVFSEGLPPEKIKTYVMSSSRSSYNDGHLLEKPKLNCNKKIHKAEEDSKLKGLLNDNFIDDPNQIPDITFTPKSLPMMYSIECSENCNDLEKTFETLQVKTEKSRLNNIKNKSMRPFLETENANSKGPKIFLFEFPKLLNERENTSVKKKNFKGSLDADQDKGTLEKLSSLGEGFFGCLRIHENGKAFLVNGKSIFPLCLHRHNVKQEVMSASINNEIMKGEVISLGVVDASFTCSAKIFQDTR